MALLENMSYYENMVTPEAKTRQVAVGIFTEIPS